MRILPRAVVPVAIGLLAALTPASAHGFQTKAKTAKKSGGSAAQPVVPLQFKEIPEAEWAAGMPLVGKEIECQNGKARIFECEKVSLLSFLPASVLGDSSAWGVTDLWGWTDSASGREFVLAGLESGTSFVEITDPVNPRYLGKLPYHQTGEPSRWREIKVYKNHAFIVSDNAGEHGIQIFDLKPLLTQKAGPVMYQETAHYDKVSSVHDITIDTVSGFAYALGSNGGGESCGGGLHMIDIHDPVHPSFAGCYAEPQTGAAGTGYVHDNTCIVYHGPDKQYDGRQICVNSSETAVSIADVTDKSNPKTLSIAKYPSVAYAHQGWLTEDHRYFYLGDELDEEQNGGNTRTMIFDVAKLTDLVLVKEYFGPTVATDHNMFVRGNYLFQANYQAGLRVLDISDPVNPKEVAFFHSVPGAEIVVGYGGSWGVYPYFRSGLIALSAYKLQVGNGLFVLRHRP